jgi:hypothetical protein
MTCSWHWREAIVAAHTFVQATSWEVLRAHWLTMLMMALTPA